MQGIYFRRWALGAALCDTRRSYAIGARQLLWYVDSEPAAQLRSRASEEQTVSTAESRGRCMTRITSLWLLCEVAHRQCLEGAARTRQVPAGP